MAETYKTKADYTILKKNHLNSSQGDIFESDFMTISPMDNIFEGTEQDIINSDSNFKFSYRISNNSQKKHSRNAWVKPPTGDDDYWTLEDTISGGSISDETVIRIKPDYNSIKDFAYYGSAMELVRGSMSDIIQNFPAEAYFTNEKLKDKILDIYGISTNAPGYIISNDFGINFHTPDIKEVEVYNKMRYISLSYNLYDIINPNGDKFTVTGVEITINEVVCEDNETGATIATAVLSTSGGPSLTVKTYLLNNEYYTYSESNLEGYRIRPCKEVIETYFNTIDEFEYVLLNRDSNPLYKAEFDTPYETDEGNFYKKQSYTFPSNYDWNPDITSAAYEKYVSRLISLAQFHDELDSNNIWRSMTHEAIKNLDWTFVREQDGQNEDVQIDSGKIEKILQLYARQYDGLKRYIDNIKNTNKITYNEKNNIPDYFLTDTVDIDGWDVKPLIATAKTDYYSNILYDNMSRGYSEVEANNNFMRNLKLNSNYILSSKGTRFGIESLLGLLGVNESINPENGKIEADFKIDEYVTVADGSTSGFCHFVSGLQQYKYPNAEDIDFVNIRKYSIMNGNDSYVPYKGIAVKEVVAKNGGKYVVPWYINGEQYDSKLYFQGRGGWGERKSQFGPIDINLDFTTAKTFTPTQITYWNETQTYLKFARTISEMLDFTSTVISSGMVCYVTDIDDIALYDSGASINTASHYFRLRNTDLSTSVGTVGSLGEGWHNIPQSELESISSEDAEMVVYLETLKESTEGNNSHVGFGRYDSGREYLDYLETIFKGSNENGDFDRFSKNDIEKAIIKYGFNIQNKGGFVDNYKCWYFGRGDDYSTCEWNTWNSDGKTATNPENGNTWEEPAANSIINIKKMSILFYYPYDLSGDLKDDYKKYIEETVIPYIMQMIPSTTIFSYDITTHNGSPSPEHANVYPVDGIDQTSSNFVVADGVIYTSVDYDNGLDMIDGANDETIINMH